MARYDYSSAADGSLMALADCDSFYTSCERVCRPDLEGRPVVVFVNLGAEKAYVEFEQGAPAADGMTDYFTGEAAALPAEMEPGQYIVWTK